VKEPSPDVPVSLFSPADDLLVRLQRAVRLVPRDGFGVKRRIALVIALTWAPIMVWAAATGHFASASPGDSLLNHLGVHVRCLIAVPLMLMAEPFAHRVLGTIVSTFVPSGLVSPEDRPRFAELLRSIARWRDSPIVLAAITVFVVATTITVSRAALLEDSDALGWLPGTQGMDFGATWALYAVRPLFLFLLLVWLWRLTITGMLFRSIAKMGLRLVPSHPDRVGGLGFVEPYTGGFAFVVAAASCVVCANAAHRILAHGAKFADFQVQLLSFVGILAAAFLLPAGAFSSPLRRARWRAKFQYGTLAGRHFQLVHARWVEGREVKDDPVLSAPELGPAADVATLHGLGTHMRVAPIGMVTIVPLLVSALLPVLIVLSLEVPLQEILLRLLKALA